MLAVACTSPNERTISELNLLLDTLQLQYAPDTQLELWDVYAQMEDGSVLLSGNLASKEAYKAVVQKVDKQFPEVKNELLLLPLNGKGQLVNGVVNNSVIHLRKEWRTRSKSSPGFVGIRSVHESLSRRLNRSCY